MNPTCSMQGLSTANRDWVYSLLMQSCCCHGTGGGSTCGGRDYQGGTASHEGNTHQGGLRCNRNPHTQKSWSVSGDRHTVVERCESSSYGTPESSAEWRLSHTTHTCRDGYLQQWITKAFFLLACLYGCTSEWFCSSVTNFAKIFHCSSKFMCLNLFTVIL